MRSVTALAILMLGTVNVSLADEDPLLSNVFTDDWGPVADFSLGLSWTSNIAPEEALGSLNAGDLSSDLLFASADYSGFQTDEAPGLWDDGTTSLSADGDNENCGSGDIQLPARLRARNNECSAAIVKETPVIIDLLDPKIKMKPICPLEKFPFYLIAVCSSGNPLDVWGPSTALLLYDSTEVTNPFDLLACIGSRRLYCCRRFIPVTDPIVQQSDNTEHGRPWGRGLGAFCAEVPVP